MNGHTNDNDPKEPEGVEILNAAIEHAMDALAFFTYLSEEGKEELELTPGEVIALGQAHATLALAVGQREMIKMLLVLFTDSNDEPRSVGDLLGHFLDSYTDRKEKGKS